MKDPVRKLKCNLEDVSNQFSKISIGDSSVNTKNTSSIAEAQLFQEKIIYTELDATKSFKDDKKGKLTETNLRELKSTENTVETEMAQFKRVYFKQLLKDKRDAILNAKRVVISKDIKQQSLKKWDFVFYQI